MNRNFRFSPGKYLSIGFTMLAVLAVALGSSRASSCTPPSSGIVAWWSGEGNANDLIATNNGVPAGGISYANGEVGQAFVFNGSTSYIPVPASPSLDIGTGSGLTIESWVQPNAQINPGYPIAEWDSASDDGLQFWVQSSFQLFANIKDTSNNSHLIISENGIVSTNSLQHVALTYDKSSGAAFLYLNGIVVATNNFGTITPQTTYPLNIGRRTGQPIGNGDTFNGLMDELGLYNRALSQAEIQSIYNAGSAGKCAPAFSAVPAIFNVTPPTGPNGTTATISGTSFSASAASDIVYFGAVRAAVLSASPTSLQVSIPTGATFAPITVTVNGLTAYAQQPFLPTFSGNGPVTNSSLAARLDLAAGAGTIQTVTADLDNDGKPDLFVADASIGKISLYRNISTNGSLTAGAFAARVDVSLLPSSGTSPYVICAADLDGDGRLDIIALNADSNVVSILRNISLPGSLTTNSFAARLDLPGGDVMRGLAVRDFNGDGKPDLAVANQTSPGSISVFQNLSTIGNIAFAARVNLVAGNGSSALASGDLDGDGQPDLAVANYDGGTISVFRNNGGGAITTNSFAAKVDFPALSTVSSVVIGDLDGDGKLDLVVGAGSFSGSQVISVFRNTATVGSITSGSFAARVDFAAGWVNSVALADLDGDGKLDIALASQVPSVFSLFKNISVPGSFTTASLAGRVDYSAGYNPNGISIGDLDGDGRPDITFGNFYDGTISIYQNVSPFGTNTPPPPSCTPAPIGLVGWWKGDGNTLDSVGANKGVNQNITYSSGVVGQAFVCDPENYAYGTYTGIQIADQPAYALTNALTIEGWVRPRGDGYVIFFRGDHRPGLDPYQLSMQASSNLDFGICDAGGNYVKVETALPYFVWTHVAATLDGSSGTLSLYTNGVLAAQTNTIIRPFAALLPDQSPGIGIGNLNDGGNNFPFLGDIDELGLYNRALTIGEIQSIYNAGSAGKCFDTVVLPQRVILVDTSTSGYYNDSLGTILDGTEPQFPLPFGIGTDSTLYPAGEPNLAAAAAVLGNWLVPGAALNGNWLSAGSISSTWALNTETAIIYEVNGGTNGFSNLRGNFDADNGIYVWVNGQYKFGARAPGLPSPSGQFEYTNVNLGNLSPGTNRIQIIREDSGISTGYQIQISGNPLAGTPPPDAPFITVQPTNQMVLVGGTTSFSATASGTQPLIYQWNFNGTNISGANNPTLTLTNIQMNQAGNYAVLVTNLYGAATSSIVSLAVTVPALPPASLSQTPSQVVLVGNPATFTVNVMGSDPLSYFWKRDGMVITGATNFSYTLNNAQFTDSGSKFSCLVTNAYGWTASTNATLKVIDSVSNDLCSGAVVVTGFAYTNLQSTAKATSFGDPVPDCVTGFGNGVWYQFTAPVAGLLVVDTFGSDFDTGLAIYTGSSDALLEIACNDDTGGVTSQVTTPTTAGTTYSILAGGYSAHTGNLAFHLNHLTPPLFVVQPTNQSVVVSNSVTFTASLTGALPMTFQWYFNGAPLVDDGRISGSTATTLSISNLTTADAGSYILGATNFLGSADSAVAILTVLVPPSITLNPLGRSVPPGLPTTLNASASGIPTPTYQWQLNGTNIPGATSASYTIPAVNTNHPGFYHIIASNLVSATTSADAQLTFGPVAAWGKNLNNECLPPPSLSNVVAVTGTSGASFALRMDGTIAAWGSGNVTNIPAGASNVVAVAASGSTANYALRSDGRVVGWNGISASGLSNIVAVAAGNNFAYALRAEGTVTNWGSVPTPGFPAGLSQITAIACGVNNALALRSDGKIFVSGVSAVTNVPASATNVIAIAGGYTYAMALRADGKVIAWGSGTITNLPASLTNIVAISAGNYSGENFGLAVRANGRVMTWGDNGSGETNPPAALTNLASIAGAAAPFHGLALVNDGSPIIIHPPIGLTAFIGRDVTLRGDAVGAQPLSYQWLKDGVGLEGATNASLVLSNVQPANYAGNYQLLVTNYFGSALSLTAPLTVLSNNTLTILSQQIAAQTNYQGSKLSLAGPIVLGNGPLRYQWFFAPTNTGYAPVPGATNEMLVLDPALALHTGNYYVAVSNQFAGITSSPAFLRVLFAKSWGYLATDPPGSLNVTNAAAIAVGNAGLGSSLGHYLVLKSDGKISSWTVATSSYGETNFVALSNSIVTAIAAGYQDSLALKSDGTLFTAGYNTYGETNVPSGLSGVTAIACGDYHDLALKADGTVSGWGQNTYLQTTNAAATNVVAIAASAQNSVALRADGSVVTWGFIGGQVPSNVTNIVAIACGVQHFLALRANGTVVGWGNNNYGQTTIATNLTNIVAIAAAANHSTLLRNDGTVVTLGAYNGQITTNAPADLANVIAIAAGGDHDLALFGTRAPTFTVQPWNRTISITATSVGFAGKCAGVQPMSYQWRLNGTNLPAATNDTLTVSQKLAGGPPPPIPSGVYQLVASNAYGVAVSRPAKLAVVIPLGDALDATNLNWLSSGSAPWFGQTNYVRPDATRVNASAARSGGIGALQETILQTTFTTNVAGSVFFWWKVSSEQFFDTLEFRINGTVQASISGEVDWTQASFPLAAGTNVLMWRYSKDVSFDSGLDAAFVDQFSFASAPVIISQPAGVLANLGNVVSLSVAATGTAPMRYQWFRNGSPISGGISSTYTMLNVARAQDGTYSVIVTNSGGMAVSSNATIVVKVPQLLGTPVLLPDGSLSFTSSDANGGMLTAADLANFEAQASTNLVDWATLPDALSLTNGLLQLQDSGKSNYNARYYRLIEH